MQIQNLPTAIQQRIARMEMPVLYADAIRALEKCKTLDDAKYYSDKSDALAAWAKIFGSDADVKAAASLKLHAYARMSQLAEEIRPQGGSRKSDGARGKSGRSDGPVTLLVEHGLSPGGATAARALGKLSKEAIDEIGAGVPRTPMSVYTTMLRPGLKTSSESWKIYTSHPSGPNSCASFLRHRPAKNIAKGMSPDEMEKARATAIELIEWLDEFLNQAVKLS